MYGNWETEDYNSVLDITVSFLGIHNWEPDIYIGFLPAFHLQWETHTAKTKCRKFETNIHRKGISGSQSQFPHSCVCEQIIISHDGSAFSAGGNMWTDPGNIQIAHRHMNVEIVAEAAQFPEKEYINGIAVAVQMRFTYFHKLAKLSPPLPPPHWADEEKGRGTVLQGGGYDHYAERDTTPFPMEEEERIRQVKPQFSTPCNCKENPALDAVVFRSSTDLIRIRGIRQAIIYTYSMPWNC